MMNRYVPLVYASQFTGYAKSIRKLKRIKMVNYEASHFFSRGTFNNDGECKKERCGVAYNKHAYVWLNDRSPTLICPFNYIIDVKGCTVNGGQQYMVLSSQDFNRDRVYNFIRCVKR